MINLCSMFLAALQSECICLVKSLPLVRMSNYGSVKHFVGSAMAMQHLHWLCYG